jgi:uncharacterized protein DUF6882
VPTFTELLDDAALLSLEHQLHLAEVLGDHSWRADLAEQKFEFTGLYPRTCTRFHLLGSAAPGPRSWLWGWANPTGYPQPLLELGAFVRDFGRQHGIRELSEPEVAFDDLPGSPTDPNVVVGMFVEAAKSVANNWTSYVGDAGGGTRAAFLVEHPDFALPAPESPRVMRVLNQSLTDLAIGDPRRAFHSYAVRRRLNPSFYAGGTRLIMRAPGFATTIHFGPEGRVEKISGMLDGATP